MRFAIFKILIALFIALAFGAMIELGFYSHTAAEVIGYTFIIWSSAIVSRDSVKTVRAENPLTTTGNVKQET